MNVPQKQCPRCGTTAPLDATFCGQCGRQYRTQFVPPADGAPHAAPAPVYPAPQTVYNAPTPVQFAPRTPSVWMLRAMQGGIAALVCMAVLAFSGVFRHDGTPNAPAVTSAPTAPQSDTPATTQDAAVRRALSDDPIESEARRVVDRESQKLNLPPPAVSADGKIHLRSGGTISQKDWDAASRKVQDSPILRQPPVNVPPF
ncbi:MAG: hypothetical protein JWN14_2920 [Chthonomonadales bacterium]|nr:hypothetical protein [Chthonomonadales bacterium]